MDAMKKTQAWVQGHDFWFGSEEKFKDFCNPLPKLEDLLKRGEKKPWLEENRLT